VGKKTEDHHKTSFRIAQPVPLKLSSLPRLGNGWLALRLTASLNRLFAALVFDLIVYGGLIVSKKPAPPMSIE
jgi:hypothetical protein